MTGFFLKRKLGNECEKPHCHFFGEGGGAGEMARTAN